MAHKDPVVQLIVLSDGSKAWQVFIKGYPMDIILECCNKQAAENIAATIGFGVSYIDVKRSNT